MNRRRLLTALGVITMTGGFNPYLRPLRADPAVKVLGDYTTRQGLKRRYLQVPVGFSDAEIVALLRRLHGEQPALWFWLLDDDSQWPQLLAALPQAEAGNYDDYPLDWVETHAVANLALELTPEGRRWVVMRGASRSDRLAVLD